MRTLPSRWAAAPMLFAALAIAAGPAAARVTKTTIPQDTVVKAKLIDELSSKDARRGDKFMAKVANDDASGFPKGTKLEGVVTEVQQSKKDEPGVLDVEIRTAVLPNGTRVAMRGNLAGLDEESVKKSKDGRLVAKKKKGSKFDAKWVGYGAAGGAILSTVMGGKTLKGAIIGALGGAAYGYLKGKGNKDEFRDVELEEGTSFGVQLQNQVAFNYDRTRVSMR